MLQRKLAEREAYLGKNFHFKDKEKEFKNNHLEIIILLAMKQKSADLKIFFHSSKYQFTMESFQQNFKGI